MRPNHTLQVGVPWAGGRVVADEVGEATVARGQMSRALWPLQRLLSGIESYGRGPDSREAGHGLHFTCLFWLLR